MVRVIADRVPRKGLWDYYELTRKISDESRSREMAHEFAQDFSVSLEHRATRKLVSFIKSEFIRFRLRHQGVL